MEENDKKSQWSLAKSEREKVLKKWEEQVKTDIFKNLIHEFRSIETDRGSLKKLKQFQNNFDWSKIRLDQLKWIEAHKVWGKKTQFLKRHLGKTQSIDIWGRKCMSIWWYDFQKQELKPNFPKFKISYILQKFSSIKSVLHRTQNICKLGWSDQKHTQ